MMKKLFAFILVVAMLMSMAVIVPFAADMEGDWQTRRFGPNYSDDPDFTAYPPAPGYEYTDEGFSTIPANYEGTSPSFVVQTKDKINIQDGVYLKFRIDEFSYGGPDGKADCWITMNVWNNQTVNIGPTPNAYGDGYGLLSRSDGINVEGAQVRAAAAHDWNYVPAVFDDEDRQIFTWQITYSETDGYQMFLNGQAIRQEENVDFGAAMDRMAENGMAYLGVAIQSAYAGGVASMTILEFGTSEEDAVPPSGSDRVEPETNMNVPAPIIDPDTVPLNQPAALYNAETVTNPLLGASGFELTPLGDNGFNVHPTTNIGFVTWTFRPNVSVDIDDFPYFAIMYKDFWGGGTIWVGAGVNMGANNDCKTSFSVYEGVLYDEEEFFDYGMAIINIADYGEDRLNMLRVDMGASEDFEICYMGVFRSWEEAEAYGNSYLGREVTADTTADTTADNTDDTTADNTDDTTADNTAGTTADVETGAETKAEAGTSAENVTDATEAEGGCASTLGFGLLAVVALAAPMLLKKKED